MSNEQEVYLLLSDYVDIIAPDEELPLDSDPTDEFLRVCERFERQYAETRRAILQVIRIPITPAFIIALTIAALAERGIISPAVAGLFGVADACWTAWKVFDSMSRHDRAISAVFNARDHAHRLLMRSSGRQKFDLEDLLKEHPELKKAIDEFQRDEERRKLQEAAERIGVCESLLS